MDGNRPFNARRLRPVRWTRRIHTALDGTDYRHEPLPLLLIREGLGMIPRLQALGPRQDPNLQEMHPLAPVLILLRMRDPRPCRRKLYIAPLEAIEQLLQSGAQRGLR